MSALEFGQMRRLDPSVIRFLVVHTQGSPSGADSSARAIHDYHRAPQPRGRGWAGIGYHRVIRKDGSIEEGRPLEYQGAHVEGLNHCSLGVVCTGNGDIAPFTPDQVDSLAKLLAEWMETYDVTLGNVLGHREVNMLPEIPRTSKSCPGLHVSMLRIRSRVLLAGFDRWPEPRVVRGIDRIRVPMPALEELEFR